MKVNPKQGKELKLNVNGYGCDDDCDEYYEKVSKDKDGCGWRKTDNTCPLW